MLDQDEIIWRHDSHHNDIQQNDTQDNDIQQNNDTMQCHYAECHYAECHYAECHYAECHYANTKCRGANYLDVFYTFLQRCRIKLATRVHDIKKFVTRPFHGTVKNVYDNKMVQLTKREGDKFTKFYLYD